MELLEDCLGLFLYSQRNKKILQHKMILYKAVVSLQDSFSEIWRIYYSWNVGIEKTDKQT